MKSVVFIGHNECYSMSTDDLNKAIIECIKKGAIEFFSGGQGGFDRTSATAVYNLKKDFPHIKNILVIPYLSFNIFSEEIFDEIIFSDVFEKYHYKVAIPQRNKYMVNHSDTAICYINHNWGNAAKTFKYAKKKNLNIINLTEYSE
ncbi:MAG: DUF1273 domain-containing protein [Ruminococcaceae bacterium]|nr:DUF1273 domain-containing protein [Oscillospiraceae bacterium]